MLKCFKHEARRVSIVTTAPEVFDWIEVAGQAVVADRSLTDVSQSGVDGKKEALEECRTVEWEQNQLNDTR